MAKYTVRLSQTIGVVVTAEVDVEASTEEAAKLKAQELALRDEVEWCEACKDRQLSDAKVESVRMTCDSAGHVAQLRRDAMSCRLYNMFNEARQLEEKADRIERGEEP